MAHATKKESKQTQRQHLNNATFLAELMRVDTYNATNIFVSTIHATSDNTRATFDPDRRSHAGVSHDVEGHKTQTGLAIANMIIPTCKHSYTNEGMEACLLQFREDLATYLDTVVPSTDIHQTFEKFIGHLDEATALAKEQMVNKHIWNLGAEK